METIGINLTGYQTSPLFFLLIIAGIAGIVTGFFLLRYQKIPGVKYLALWEFAASYWAITYAFEFSALDIITKVTWSKFSYFGIVYCPVTFLLFTLGFSSQFKLLSRRNILILFVIASLFIISPMTNDWHHLHWKSYWINEPENTTAYIYGPFFWMFFAFTYILLISGIANILLLFFRLTKYYRTQIILLSIASFLPLVGNILYVFHINPIIGFDWTPFTFLLTGILITINITRFGAFELVPFARNKLIDIMPDAVFITDSSGRIADINAALLKLSNLKQDELIGKKIDIIVPEKKQLIEKIRTSDVFQTEISHKFNGKEYYFDIQVTGLYDHRQMLTGRLVVLRDITRHMKAEKKILDTNHLLTEEIKEKEKLISDLNAFSHTVAHDLKNVIGAIISSSELMKRELRSDPFSKEDLGEINDIISLSSNKMLHIVKELLTLASVRQQEIKTEVVNMSNVVSESLSRMKDMIHEHKAQIQIPGEWPEVVGYGNWLEEVWINYISNAIKYGGTPPVIQLGCTTISKKTVRFWIKDNGKGLSNEERALLFNPFTRLDQIRVQGHGLGLSIVKRIIEKLNGKVGVESTGIEGQGSIFYFELPAINNYS